MDYQKIVDKMPPGIERGTLRIISYHIGKPRAIGSNALVAALSSLGIHTNERQVRIVIRDLRRAGHLICSVPGDNGGYYLASNRVEYDEFRQAEYQAKISDMQETMTAMDKAARQAFGIGYQQTLRLS
jgi:predicted transcriptional regulator